MTPAKNLSQPLVPTLFLTLLLFLLIVLCAPFIGRSEVLADLQNGEFTPAALADSDKVALQGQWRYFPNQLVSAEALRDKRSQAQTVILPSAWSPAQLLDSPLQNATFWLTLNNIPDASNLALSINQVCGPTRLQLFYADKPSQYNQVSSQSGALFLTLPGRVKGPLQLLVQVESYGYRQASSCGQIYLGKNHALIQQKTLTFLQPAILMALLSMATIYAFSIFSQRRSNKAPLWLMCSGLCILAFYAHSSGLLSIALANSALAESGLIIRSGHIALIWSMFFVLLFYHQSFHYYLSPQLLKNIGIANIAASLLLAFTPLPLQTALLTLTLAFILLQMVTALWLLWAAIKQHERYARQMLVAILPLSLIAPHDFSLYLLYNETPMLVLYALVFFIVIETHIISTRFAHAFGIAERLTLNLKEEVSLQTAELYAQNNKLAKAQQALQAANIELRNLSVTDGLTGAHNRMYFDQEFRKEWRRCNRQQVPVSILMVDADHFKKLNDEHGHLAGDLCLRAIADQMKSHFKRAGELVARYGGEEFVVMLPDTSEREACLIAETLRQSIANLEIPFHNKALTVTVSIGLSSTVPANEQPADQLLMRADNALYQAKQQGRNQVCSLPLILPRAKQSQES